ncbi:MAG: hypothetical protein IJZ54_07415 [Clostridia bacterium]|nr:hypothetical protein [Clostridia bacterium]
MSKNSCCEMCAHYMYDEAYDCYICEINLDEDEMESFLRGSDFECHYFSAYDEYKIVRKQN